VLPGDSDLDAFYLDHFQSVHQRFSLGMERQAKLNLLLQYVSTEELVAALNRYAAAEFTQEHEALNRDKALKQVLWHLPRGGISMRIGSSNAVLVPWSGKSSSAPEPDR
jgi:hypothetical protein